MNIKLPELCLAVLVGPSGSGKSTFAARHFRPTEVVSSDVCRGMLSDDENDQKVTGEAFDLLHTIVGKRLALGRLAVVDATNVQKEARAPLVRLARKHYCLPVAIVLDVPERVCHERNEEREDRNFGRHVVRQHRSEMRRSLKRLKREGFRHVFVLRGVEEIENATIERVPLWNNKRGETGPFDIIGDIHGCGDELEILLGKLGYEQVSREPDPLWGDRAFHHPEGRRAIFVGDLVDRGPRILDTLRIVRNMVEQGSALCVPGNHDDKLKRKLWGKNVQITHGLETTLAEIDALPEADRGPFRESLAEFLGGLISHYVLDGGKLVVAHAGLKESMQGRASGKVREFCLYGETTGETDERGLPERLDWAAEYRGDAQVVYGHTPVAEPEWLNRTVNIDTGCVYGGKLTALRYPEGELVSVPAKRAYAESPRSFLDGESREPPFSAQQRHDDLLDVSDVRGKRIVSTPLQRNITIREENATAALEVISRFAVDPKWLVYLPPTMSPTETSNLDGLLEHPAEAFSYFRGQGVPEVVCEEKHMGSRAVVVICRDEDAARERFGIAGGGAGTVFTRTGRPFFSDEELESDFLARVRDAMSASGFWEEFGTGWACLDCELMPWSVKAQGLLRSQYAAVGAAGSAALPRAVEALSAAVARMGGEEEEKADAVLGRSRGRQQRIGRFVDAYRQYCWPVDSLADLKLAPFHLMATEGKVHADRNHLWHMETLAKICRADPGLLLATECRAVDLNAPGSTDAATGWWSELTGRGGEGMVVKPLDWVVHGKKGIVQPAVKCRGREYLRIIYGPDYTSDENLPRLRHRGLGRKRSLALREFALGLEALERFVRGEPLRRVHECVFGVLALESEPVDPRL